VKILREIEAQSVEMPFDDSEADELVCDAIILGSPAENPHW
jgi:hypothetical protein